MQIIPTLGEFKLFSIDNFRPDRKFNVYKVLPPRIYKEACEILIEFLDIFSWTSANLRSISQGIVEYRLGIPGTAQLSCKRKDHLLKRDSK